MKKQSTYQRYGNYIINRGDSLGSGTYGKVYRGYSIISENSFGNNERLRLQPVAIKQSYCQPQNYQEINILKILKHPNIIRYIDYKIYGNSLFMVMELCQQGTLEDLLMELPQDQNLHDLLYLYFSQIVNGIRFMYEKNILHRDIKPSNILIKDNQVKIADFGTSKLNQEKQLRTLVGTPLFSSPELLEISLPSEQDESEPSKSTYTEQSDIWSLGFVLYLMFNYQRQIQPQGQRLKSSLPWSGRHAGQVLKNILTKPLQMKRKDVPENIQKIIEKMLKINPQERMGFKQFLNLPEFQQKTIKHIKLNLNESNLALSRSFVPQDSLDDDYCLTHSPQNDAVIAQEIQKKPIDWQLLKLLQIKDSQHYQDDEINQAIQFYQLILTELNDVYEIGDEKLLYAIERKNYQLHSWRLWNLQYQHNNMGNSNLELGANKSQVKGSNENSIIFKIQKESIQQVLDQIIGRYSNKKEDFLSTFDEEKFKKILEKPESQQLISKEKILIDYMKPNAQLKNAIKLYIKLKFTEQLISTFQGNKIKCNMTLDQQLIKKRRKCLFIYDLFIFLQFQFSWKAKNKLNSSYGKKYNTGYSKNSFVESFKTMKNSVNIKQIIARNKLAYAHLQIQKFQSPDEQ